MGNSTGNVAKYWALFEAEPAAQGAFIWDWVDQAMDHVDEETGVKYWAYGGDFGDEPNDAQFVCNGMVFPDRTPHPAAYEMKYLQAPVSMKLIATSTSQEAEKKEASGTRKGARGKGRQQKGTTENNSKGVVIEIFNKDYFLSTEWLDFRWRMLVNGFPYPAHGDPSETEGEEEAKEEEEEIEMFWYSLDDDDKEPIIQPRCFKAFQVFDGEEWESLKQKVCEKSKVFPEIHFEVQASLRDDYVWAEEGFVVCEMQEQYIITREEYDAYKEKKLANTSKRARLLPTSTEEPSSKTIPVMETTTPSAPPVSISSSLLTLESTDGTASISIDTVTGTIPSYKVKGIEMFTTPLKMCFYRAPTDNDRGGSSGTSYAARWKAAGLDRLVTKPGSCEVTINNATRVVQAKWTLVPEKLDGIAAEAATTLVEGVGVGEVGGMHWLSEAPDTAAGGSEVILGEENATAEGHIDIKLSIRFREDKNNALELRWEVDTTHALPAPLANGLLKSLPRVGIEFGVTPCIYDADGVTPVEGIENSFLLGWYGRGPHECYSDRKASGIVRHHQFRDAKDLHVPYVFPSESGGRCDVRFLSLISSSTTDCDSSTSSKERDKCFSVQSLEGQLFQFSASPYTVAEFERARHNHELRPSEGDCIHFHIDTAHMGVGGDDSWSPTVHEEFLVPPKVYKFGIVLAGDL
jgi:beta-galactosidase